MPRILLKLKRPRRVWPVGGRQRHEGPYKMPCPTRSITVRSANRLSPICEVMLARCQERVNRQPWDHCSLNEAARRLATFPSPNLQKRESVKNRIQTLFYFHLDLIAS
jgi:hypothetical protein